MTLREIGIKIGFSLDEGGVKKAEAAVKDIEKAIRRVERETEKAAPAAMHVAKGFAQAQAAVVKMQSAISSLAAKMAKPFADLGKKIAKPFIGAKNTIAATVNGIKGLGVQLAKPFTDAGKKVSAFFARFKKKPKVKPEVDKKSLSKAEGKLKDFSQKARQLLKAVVIGIVVKKAAQALSKIEGVAEALDEVKKQFSEMVTAQLKSSGVLKMIQRTIQTVASAATGLFKHLLLPERLRRADGNPHGRTAGAQSWDGDDGVRHGAQSFFWFGPVSCEEIAGKLRGYCVDLSMALFGGFEFYYSAPLDELLEILETVAKASKREGV